MIKKILIALVLALSLVSVNTASANEAFIDIPVTVNVEGGCILNTPSHSVETIAVWTTTNYRFVDDYEFRYTCSNGTAFSLVFNPGGSPTIKLNKDGSRWIDAKFYNSDGTTDITAGGVILTGTGDAQEKTAIIKPAIKYNAANPACSGSGNIYTCETGTYAKNLTIKATW